MAEPKIRRIQTQSGKVFEGPDAEQKFRGYLDSLGAGVGGMELSPVIDAYKNRGDITNIEYEPTQPPPTGAASVAGGVAESLSGRASQGKGLIGSALEFTGEKMARMVGGVGSSVLSIPISVMRVAGYDPNQAIAPTASSYGGQVKGVPISGVPAPILATPFSKKPSEEEEKRPKMTVGEMQESLRPTEFFGKAAEFGGDIFGFGAGKKGLSFLGGLAERKVPAIIAKATEAKPVQFVADKAADFGLSLFQELGKTGSAKDAADAATYGTIVDLGLSGTGKTISSLYKKYGADRVREMAKHFADRSIPKIKGVRRDDRADLEYKRELATRLLETGSDFTEKGSFDIWNRFQDTVKAMKNASSKSDEMLEELNRLKLIGEEDLKQVDYASNIKAALDKLRSSQVTPDEIARINLVEQKLNELLPKKFKLDANGNKIPVKVPLLGAGDKPVLAPNGKPIMVDATDEKGNPIFEVSDELDKLTFKEAENKKEKLNAVLEKFYNNGTLTPADQLDKQVRLVYADALRKAQQEAFDSTANLKGSLAGKIPASSKAASMRPWEVKVPLESRPVSYRDASLLAMKDADLSKIAIEAVQNVEPQPGGSWFNEMAAAIGISQFLHGSLFTPSQMATAWQISKNQMKTSLSAGKAQRASRSSAAAAEELRGSLPKWLQPATRVPSSMFGKAAAISERSDQPQSTPSMERLIGEQKVEVVPEPAPAQKKSYWNKTF